MNEGERIIKLETQMDNIEEKVDKGFEELNKKMDSFIEKSEERFASKWVEKGMTATIGFVLLGVGGAILALIFK